MVMVVMRVGSSLGASLGCKNVEGVCPAGMVVVTRLGSLASLGKNVSLDLASVIIS